MTQVNKKRNRMGNFLMGIIAIVAVCCFLPTACHKAETEKKTKGTITANSSGTVSFMYSRIGKNQEKLPDACTFVTNLPAPNEKFTLHVSSSQPTDTKTITGLQAGQKIEWETNVEGNPINTGSDIGDEHFVHIINE